MGMDNNDELFSLSGRIRSIGHAVDGVIEMLKGQHNSWVHIAITLAVIALAFLFRVTAVQWCVLIIAITLVWVVEALNTAFESLCDVVSPEFHPLVRKSKDIAAGAVLISAIGAITLGLIVFIPHAWGVMAYMPP
ncbi:MAG: diacylglycerol kinase family protein [Halieaceae bacterium]|jgi:diacylglycerol kinase (ATP)|nr:diacylglycerol kinase family protein [Halieaceae bacterium]